MISSKQLDMVSVIRLSSILSIWLTIAAHRFIKPKWFFDLKLDCIRAFWNSDTIVDVPTHIVIWIASWNPLDKNLTRFVCSKFIANQLNFHLLVNSSKESIERKFPRETYVNIMQLLDLCILDVGSLRWVSKYKHFQFLTFMCI